MHEKKSLTICIQQIIHKRVENIDSIFNEEEDNDIQFGKKCVATELINIATKITPLNHESLTTIFHKINHKFCLDVTTNSTTINQGTPINTSNLDVKIDETTI
jgi:hypothetical protein